MAPRREHDKPDLRLIIEGSRQKKQAKRAGAGDYPETITERQQMRGSGENDYAKPVLRKETAGKQQINPHIDTQPLRATLLEGDAVGSDGNLKDAEDMEWLHSPSEEISVIPGSNKRVHSSIHLSDDDGEQPGILGPIRRTRSRVVMDSDDDGMDVDHETHPRVNHVQLTSEDESYFNQDHNTTNSSRPASTTFDDEGDKECDKGKEGEAESDNEDEGPESGNIDGNERYRALCIKLGKNMPVKIKETKDIRLCFAKDVRKVNGVMTCGEYCKFCLMDPGILRSKAFFTGNVTSRRRHLIRKHIIEYVTHCEEKGVQPKGLDTAPDAAQKKLRVYRGEEKGEMKQERISSYAVKVTRPAVITKSVLKEMLLALITDADLPFRFVERPLFRRFILLLNSKVKDSDIPKKSCIADAVISKVYNLDIIDFKLISEIPSKITGVYDGWSTKRRRHYSSFSISYIYSPPDDDTSWTLKTKLLDFTHMKGQHTGDVIGKDLARVVEKFGFSNKLGWMVGDNVTVNDVAIRVLCETLDPSQQVLVSREVRGRCINHTTHLSAAHFVKALGIPKLLTARQQLHATGTMESIDDDSEDEDDFDINISMAVDADDHEAEALTITDYDAGDVVGKLMAFINQLRGSSEGTRDFLKTCCIQNGSNPFELKLWVRTRWGSLSDCFQVAIAQQDAIDEFCMLADNTRSLPKLRKGKTWQNYKLTSEEWNIVTLAYNCLKVPASLHSTLSAEKIPTATKVYPHLDYLQSNWEDLRNNPEYKPVYHALDAGLKNMKKWYNSTEKTTIYLVTHVIDPTLKMVYIKSVWDPNSVGKAMKRLKKVFLEYKMKYDKERSKSPVVIVDGTHQTSTQGISATENWIASRIRQKPTTVAQSSSDPCAELQQYLSAPILQPVECPNPVTWWGVQNVEYPILRLIARDYLPIPASSCLAERSFSMSARTDDPRRGSMNPEKFGALQRLRDAYRDGSLVPEEDILKEFIGDFSLDLLEEEE